MGLLANIFGNSKNAEKTVDGAIKGLDKMFFTKEEKAEANQKLSDWYLKYLEATQPQNQARRLLAMVVAFLWAFLVLVGVIAKYFDTEYSEFVFKVLTDVVTNPFMLIMSFYFVAHAVRAYQSGKK